MSYKNTAVFEDMPVSKAVYTMAIPTIIGQLIVLVYNMADTFFIGRTNDPYMVAGVSLILPIFNILISIAGLAGVGGGTLVSRLLGKKDTDEVKKVYSFSIYLGVSVAAIFSVIVLLFEKPLMLLLGAGDQTYTYASEYAFCVIVLGGIPTVLSNILSTHLRSAGESGKAGFGITMGGIINIALDPLFMFVLFPAGKEIMGAGMATCLSNCISCGYFIAVLIRMRQDSVLRLCPPSRLPRRESIASIFCVGLPSAIATFLFDMDYIVIDRLMANYGDVALAAVGIVLKVERLPLNVGIGICQGMMPIVAYNYSSKNLRRMNEVKNYSCMLGIIFAIISVTLYEIFAGQIMNIFINDAQTVALGTGFLRVRCLATPLMFLSFFHVYLFNSFGKGGYALFLGVMRWLAFNIPMLFLLDLLIGMNGIVWSQFAADILTVLLSVTVYKLFEKRTDLCYVKR